MSDHDPVDAVILAFLDYLEGVAVRPTLDHLTDPQRVRAESLLAGLVAGRGINPDASRPSIESLLVDTPLGGLFPLVNPAAAGGVELTTVQRVLGDVDSRARVDIDAASATVVYSYLDLRARFLLVAAAAPVVTAQVRAMVAALFDADPDTSRVGVVAARSDELMTQVLSADDLGRTITTPRGEPHLRWDPRLPLTLAARRILEQSAPEWPAFEFGGADQRLIVGGADQRLIVGGADQRGTVDHAYGDPLDLTTVAAEIARRVIEREAGRSYRGDKRRAYQAMVGQERAFADLVARVCVPGTDLDLDEETERILRAAA